MSGASINAMMENCKTCGIVKQYIDMANGFTQDLSVILLDPMQTIFLSLVALWSVINGIKMALATIDIKGLGKEVIYIFIAGFLLMSQGPNLVNKIYTTSLSLMGSAATVAISVGSKTTAATSEGMDGMVALVASTEEAVKKIFKIAFLITDENNWYKLQYPLFTIALVVPYFLLLITFFSQVVMTIFRVMMLSALSPFILLAYGFGWGREIAKKAITTLLSAAVVLFGATAAVGSIMYAVSGIDGSKIDFKNVDLSNEVFLLALALGWMGTAFVASATSMANSISGAALSNVGAGIITAGAAGTAAMAAKMGGRTMGVGAANLFSDATKGAGWVAAAAGAPKSWAQKADSINEALKPKGA